MRRRGLIFRLAAGAAVTAALWLASLGTALAQTPGQIPGSDLIPQPTLSPSTGQITSGTDVLPSGTDPTGILQPPGGDPQTNGSTPARTGGSGGAGTGGSRGGITGGGTGISGARLTDPGPATTIGESLREFEDRDDSLGAVADRAIRLAVPLAAPLGIALLGLAGLLLMAKGSGRLESLESEKEALGGRAVIRL